MVAQAKMAIDTRNGTMVHPSSSQMEPVIGAPTFSPVRSRYFTAKTMTKNTTSSATNAVTAVTKKYRLSTSGARLDACSGKSGMPSSINRYGLTPGAAPGGVTHGDASPEIG